MALILTTEQWGMHRENGSHAPQVELGSMGTSPTPRTARTSKEAKMHFEAREVFTKSSH